MPLPPVAGVKVLDIDPPSFGLADGTALTFANSGLTPTAGSPTYKTSVFATGLGSVRVVQTTQGFSVTRPVADDFTIYASVKNMVGAGTGANFYNNGSFIDSEQPFNANDFAITLRADGRLCAGTGNPDTSATGLVPINDGFAHNIAITRKKSTGVMNVYVDGVLDITLTNNTNSLNGAANLSFGSGPASADAGGDYGRVLAYDATHSSSDLALMEAYLFATYGDPAAIRSTKSVSYGVTGPPLTISATKAQAYGVLGPPLLLSCTKSVMYVITGPDDGTRQRLKVRLVKSHR